MLGNYGKSPRESRFSLRYESKAVGRTRRTGFRGLRLEKLEQRMVLNSGPLLISEFMAVNNSTLTDAEGDFSDWLEIYNPTTSEVDLAGWHLTDDADNLDKWAFPQRTLAAHDHLVVFASNKDRRDPAGELHANFKLSGSGEYLALVRPDGTTVSHAYAPTYPSQAADVSYGVTERTSPLVSPGAEVSFFVPTVDDSTLGTEWTEPVFDYAPWTAQTRRSPLLITEIGTRNPDSVEIQNLSGEVLDTTGWRVVANNGSRTSGGINVLAATAWTLPDSIDIDEVLYRDDDDEHAETYWGGDLVWSTYGAGWVSIIDDQDRVVDFVAWGFDDETFATMDVTIGATHLGPTSYWHGPPVSENVSSSSTLQRHGSADNDDASDWSWGAPNSHEEQNAELVPPFAGAPTTGIGFGPDSTVFGGAIQTNVGSRMEGVNASIWTRVPFTVDDPTGLDSLRLLLKYNDGFIAYLNGQEVARRNAPEVPTWDSSATAVRDDSASVIYEEFDVSVHAGTLVAGNNVLAIHGLNADAADDDFLLVPKLVGTNARGEVRFFANASPGQRNPSGGVIINEMHYDPYLKTEPIEFIEIYNTLDVPMDLSGWQLTDGIEYVFPVGTILGDDQYLVIAETPLPGQNQTAFEDWYGFSPAGYFAGSLDNDGERIKLRDATGKTWDEVDYQLGFPWPTVGGRPTNKDDYSYSIELIHPEMDNDLGGSWRASQTPSGTPGAANSAMASNAAPQMRQVNHLPNVPASGEEVMITAKVTDVDGVASVTLAYQLVDPGNYIRLGDEEYETDWTIVAMLDDGAAGDATAGDDVYTVVLPGSLQTHRRLVRYRITTEDTQGAVVTAPYVEDEQPNFAYFVYDGVPEWTGADRPGVTSPVTFDAGTMNQLPTYHLIADGGDITNVQYSSGYEQRRMLGTIVYDGEVYDHIEFGIRGEFSTYVSGKNKWKFFFNRGHDFQAHDGYGKKHPEKWRTMNFSAAATPWMPVNRGMGGMDEAIAFRLYELAGVPAPRMNPLQFRVIDGQEEAPSSQYDGDLWGLYWTIENPDGRFLDARELPDGNVYKIEGGQGDKKNQGPTHPLDRTDVSSFISAYGGSRTIDWWRDNVDLDAYYSFRSIGREINNMDIREGWNVFYYHQPETDQWIPIPWDLDMLYAPTTHWSGVINMQNAIKQHAELNREYQARGRELQDLLFTSDQLGQVVDEYAAMINPLGKEWTMVDVDQFMWNYHPRTRGGHMGAFYKNPADTDPWAPVINRTLVTADHEGMAQWLKDFMLPAPGGGSIPAGYGFDFLAGEAEDADIPLTPTITYAGAANYPINNLWFTTGAFADPQGSQTFGAMQWRIGEVTDVTAPAYDPTDRPVYEITPVWESDVLPSFTESVHVPAAALELGHAYRARVRMQDNTGRWSHWSAPIQFVPADATAAALPELQITEIMFHPAPPTAEELALNPALTADDFEYLEFRNTGTTPIDLRQFQLVDGIAFDFAQGDVATLPSGAFAVVVKNSEAFHLRYGNDHPAANIAGQFTLKLNNAGERLTMIDGHGLPVLNFRYDTGGDWAREADGRGASLELIAPDAVPFVDPARTDFLEDGENWRRSVVYGGTPGRVGELEIGIVINEVLTRSTPPRVDMIELHNTTDIVIDLSGWYVSDSWGWGDDANGGNYRKYRIADGTLLAAGAYLVLDESDFNPSGGLDPRNHPDDFALSGTRGDDVWLLAAHETGALTHFVDRVEFGAAREGESFGRWIDDQGNDHFYPMATNTFGAALAGEQNSGPRVGTIVFGEIMYHAEELGVGETAISLGDLEYIELVNPTSQAISLDGWRIRGGVDYDFDPAMQIGPHDALVVLPFDPHKLGNEQRWADFAAYYALDVAQSARFVGGYAGQLANDGDMIRLLSPDTPSPTDPNFVPDVIEDEIHYGRQAPWPATPDGFGQSLHRLDTNGWGHNASSWNAATPTPGLSDLAVPSTEVVGQYVFYNNSAYDGNDEAADLRDDMAIAPHKMALFLGETATAANYTNYVRGLNGVMIDVVGLADSAAISTADFRFKVGNDTMPNNWLAAPTPREVTVRRGDGTQGSDRVTITWDDSTIVDTWLEVTMLAGPSTGLVEDHVFYFGNAIAEAGDSTDHAMVTAADELLVRNSLRGLANIATIDMSCDFNRDRLVNMTDRIIARNHRTAWEGALRLITPVSLNGLSQGGVAAASDVGGELEWLRDFVPSTENLSDGSVRRSHKSKQVAEAVDLLLTIYD